MDTDTPEETNVQQPAVQGGAATPEKKLKTAAPARAGMPKAMKRVVGARPSVTKKPAVPVSVHEPDGPQVSVLPLGIMGAGLFAMVATILFAVLFLNSPAADMPSAAAVGAMEAVAAVADIFPSWLVTFLVISICAVMTLVSWALARNARTMAADKTSFEGKWIALSCWIWLAASCIVSAVMPASMAEAQAWLYGIFMAAFLICSVFNAALMRESMQVLAAAGGKWRASWLPIVWWWPLYIAALMTLYCSVAIKSAESFKDIEQIGVVADAGIWFYLAFFVLGGLLSVYAIYVSGGKYVCGRTAPTPEPAPRPAGEASVAASTPAPVRSKAKWWRLSAAAVACVGVVAGLFFCFQDRTFTFNSPQDFQEYFEYKAGKLGKLDPAYESQVLERIPHYMLAFSEDDGKGKRGEIMNAQAEVAVAMAAFGEVGAIDYLFNERKICPPAANYAFIVAASCGRLEVMKHLTPHLVDFYHESVRPELSYFFFQFPMMTRQGFVYKLPCDSAYKWAASNGQVEVCRYLVEECGVSPDEVRMRDLIGITNEDYAATARFLSHVNGTEVTVDEVKQKVVQVAAFLVEKSGGYSYASPSLRRAAEQCDNPGIADVLPKQ